MGAERTLARGTRWGPSVVTVAVTAALLTACGSAGTPAAPARTSAPGAPAGVARAGSTHYPLTVQDCGQALTFPAPPTRVVTLGNGALTAELVALGLKDRITLDGGFASGSDVPGLFEKVQTVKHVDTAGIPTAEAMLALKPDLVTSGRGDSFFSTKRGYATREELAAVDANAYVPIYDCAGGAPNTSADATERQKQLTVRASYDEIRLFGQIFNVSGSAQRLIEQIRGQIDKVTQALAGRPAQPVAVVDAASGTTKGATGAVAQNGVLVYDYGIANDVVRLGGGDNAYADLPGTFGRISQEEFNTRPVSCFVVNSYQGAPAEDVVRSYFRSTFPKLAASRNNCFVFLHDALYAGAANGYGVTAVGRALHPDSLR